METWFTLAVTSTLAAGMQAFLYKIAAKEKIDIVVLSFYSAIFSSLLVLIAVIYFSDFSGLLQPMLLFSGLTTLTYLITTVTKVRGLENIDSAIFFPLYKVFGPAIVIVLGIIFFDENFSNKEWLGLIISLFIPLLLITKAENSRQYNLRKGLWWLLLSVVIGGIGVAFWKNGADIAPNPWMFILSTELFMIPIAYSALLTKHRNCLRKKLSVVKTRKFVNMLVVSSIANAVAGAVFVFAVTTGGALGIVYTINSLYILIPIVLSIAIYNEHWNAQKILAILLSIVALGFLG